MLTEHGGLAEGFGSILVGNLVLIGPAFGLQWIDDILATHKVDIATAEIVAEVFILLLCIQGDERFTGLTERHEQKLQKIGLTLSRVAQDEDIAVGLVIATAIEVHKDIGSVSVLADIEAVGIGLTGIVKRIEVRYGGRGKHTFKERCECVISARHTGFEAFLLTESQTVYRDALSCQLHIDLGLKLLQLVEVRRGQLNEHRTMQ